MDIIEKYLPYTSENQNQLHPNIKGSIEYGLTRGYATRVDELQKLRILTMGSATVDKGGAIKLTPTPGLAALEQKIEGEQQKLERLVANAAKIGSILDGAGAESCAILSERKATFESTVQSNPQRAFDFFLQTRGKGAAELKKLRVHWLPSDICKEPEYAAAEARWRSEMEDAKIALEPVNAALGEISRLASEIT
jgi:hypothetical protein